MKWRSVLAKISDYHPGKRRIGSIKLSSNENPLGPSPAALEAITRHAGEVSVYPPVVPAEFTSHLAAWRHVAADNVIAGNGSDEIFNLAASTLMEPGLNSVGSDHSFSQYEFSTTLFGGEYRKAPMKDLHFDLDAMLSLIDANTRMVFICNPNNPTGRMIGTAELERFIAAVPADIMIVVDQAYREYADPGVFPDAAALIGKYPNLLVTGTFSKIFGLAALRIGYGLAAPAVIARMFKVKSPFNNSNLAVEAAKAALDDSDFLRQSIELNRLSRRTFCDALDRKGVSYLESQANFLCVKSPVGKAAPAVDALENAGITVRDLSSFGLEDYLRITLAEPELMLRIAEILGGL